MLKLVALKLLLSYLVQTVIRDSRIVVLRYTGRSSVAAVAMSVVQ
jgi:hypothetical protein